jgi:uncharacterized protein (TIGR02246 family)
VSDRPDGSVEGVSRATAALLDAVNSSNRDGVVALWCDDGILMPPHRPSVRGRSEIAQYFERVFDQRRFRFDFTASHIDIASDLAVERVEYRSSAWAIGGGPEVRDAGKGVHVYRRQADGSWKLAMDIWNSDDPA